MGKEARRPLAPPPPPPLLPTPRAPGPPSGRLRRSPAGTPCAASGARPPTRRGARRRRRRPRRGGTTRGGGEAGRWAASGRGRAGAARCGRGGGRGLGRGSAPRSARAQCSHIPPQIIEAPEAPAAALAAVSPCRNKKARSPPLPSATARIPPIHSVTAPQTGRRAWCASCTGCDSHTRGSARRPLPSARSRGLREDEGEGWWAGGVAARPAAARRRRPESAPSAASGTVARGRGRRSRLAPSRARHGRRGGRAHARLPPPPSPSLSPQSPHTYATPGAAGSWGVAPSMAGGVGARCGGVGAARSTAARRPRLPRVGIQSCVLPPPLKKKYHRERRRAQNKGRPTQTAFFCYKKIKNNLADGRTRTYAGYPI